VSGALRNDRRFMRVLHDTRWIVLKGGLFLLLGMLSGTVLLLGHPTLTASALLVITIWAFCRFYYFAFYVVEHYVDHAYRFKGLVSFALYLVRRGSKA
jgi:hypothetical protein